MAKVTAQHVDTYQSLQGKFKKIKDYTDEELEATIAVLGNSESYKLLNFIDAYFERRLRKELALASK